MKVLICITITLIIQSNFIWAQNTHEHKLIIDKNEFLKKELYGKIVSVTVNKYPFNDNQLELKPSYKTIFTFSNKQNLIKTEYIDCKKNDTTTYYQEFDDKNNIIEERSSKPNSTKYFIYDDFNRLINEKSEIYDTIITTSELKYDSIGRLIEKHQYNVTCRYSYENDSKNYNSFSVYNKYGKLSQFSTYEYDEDGNCTKEIRKLFNGDKVKKSWVKYKYNKSQLISLKNSWAGESLTFYDEIGSIIKQIYSNGDILENVIIYDDYKNEKQVITYKNGVKIECFEYLFDYLK